MKKINILLALIAVFAFSACNYLPSAPVEETTMQPVEGTTPVVDESVPAEEAAPAVADENVPSALASRYGANLNCDLLKTEINRQNCKLQLNEVIGSLLETEIVNSFDVERCKDLAGSAAEECQAFLSETGVKGPVSEEEFQIFAEAVSGTYPEESEAGTTGYMNPVYDKSKCSGLTTEGYKEFCEKQIDYQMYQIELQEVINSGDVKGCDKFTDKTQQDECKMFFGVGMEEPTAMPMPIEPDVVMEESMETPPGAEVVAPVEEELMPSAEEEPAPVEPEVPDAGAETTTE